MQIFIPDNHYNNGQGDSVIGVIPNCGVWVSGFGKFLENDLPKVKNHLSLMTQLIL